MPAVYEATCWRGNWAENTHTFFAHKNSQIGWLAVAADTGLVAYEGEKEDEYMYVCASPEQMRNSFSLDAKQKYYVFINESLSNEAQYEMRFEWDHSKSLINKFAQSYAFLSHDTIALHIFSCLVIVKWVKERRRKNSKNKYDVLFVRIFIWKIIVYRFGNGSYFRRKKIFHVRLTYRQCWELISIFLCHWLQSDLLTVFRAWNWNYCDSVCVCTIF